MHDMARTDPQVNIRIPAELKAKLDTAAADSGRSLTAEIVQRLDASYAGSHQAEVSAAMHAAISSIIISSFSYETLRISLTVFDEESSRAIQTKQLLDTAFINIMLMVRVLRSMEPDQLTLEKVKMVVKKTVGTDEPFTAPLDGLPPFRNGSFDPSFLPIAPHHKIGEK